MSLQDRFTGRLVLKGDAGYEDARWDRVFNHRRVDRYPAGVLYPETEQDIINGMLLAKEQGWRVGVKSGGHSWAAWSVRDGNLLLDMSRFKQLSYDEETGICMATSSWRGGNDVAPFLAERGRMFPGGHCPDVCIGGFLLQGGQGWNSHTYGWGAEWIDSMDVVTADGELVHCSETENADLFWAARGSGPGFFGVVVRFFLRTMPKPKGIHETVHIYRLEDFDDVMQWVLENQRRIGKTIEMVCVTAVPDQPIPGAPDGHLLHVTGVSFADSAEEAARELAWYNECPYTDRALLRVDCVPADLPQFYERQGISNPEGHRWVVDNAWIDADGEDVVARVKPAFTEIISRKGFTIWYSMAPLRQLTDMAFDLQSEIYLSSYQCYQDAADDRRMKDWTRRVMSHLEPVQVGQYTGDSDFTMRQVKFMSERNYAKFLDIRAKWDPDQRFVGYLTKDEATLNTNEWQ